MWSCFGPDCLLIAIFVAPYWGTLLRLLQLITAATNQISKLSWDRKNLLPWTVVKELCNFNFTIFRWLTTPQVQKFISTRHANYLEDHPWRLPPIRVPPCPRPPVSHILKPMKRPSSVLLRVFHLMRLMPNDKPTDAMCFVFLAPLIVGSWPIFDLPISTSCKIIWCLRALKTNTLFAPWRLRVKRYAYLHSLLFGYCSHILLASEHRSSPWVFDHLYPLPQGHRFPPIQDKPFIKDEPSSNFRTIHRSEHRTQCSRLDVLGV